MTFSITRAKRPSTEEEFLKRSNATVVSDLDLEKIARID